MRRKTSLVLVFLVCLLVGFWAAAAPLAVVIKVIWWNDAIGPQADLVIGSAGLIGGAAFAIGMTDMLAKRWNK